MIMLLKIDRQKNYQDLQKRIDLANIDNCGPCNHSDIPKENKYKINSGHFDVKNQSYVDSYNK